MSEFENFVSRRYLKTRRKGAFVRILMRYARWGIALGVFVLVLVQALMNGFKEEIQKNLFTATGHFTVFHVAGDIPDTEKALSIIRGTKGVVGASPMRLEKGLLKSERPGSPTEPLFIKAIDPLSAGSTSSIFDSLYKLELKQMKEGDLLLGKELGMDLGLRPGDKVNVAFMRMDLGLGGLQPKVMGFRVADYFETHISEYDRRWGFIHIRDAMRLASSDQADSIEVRASSTDAIDAVKPQVMQSLNRQSNSLFLSSDLRDTNKTLFAALKFEKLLFAVVLALIVMLAAFNIVAILVLFVTEKRRDLGVLLALGATPRQVQRIFELQGIRICAVGTAWGLCTSIPFCFLADHYKLLKLPPALYDFITYVPFRMAFFDVAVVAVFPLLVAWAASRYPARHAAEVNPVDALRSE